MICPRLIDGEDYKAEGRWPVVTRRVISAPLGFDLGAVYEFYSGPHLLGRHERGKLTICKRYACDGYSPVLRLFGKFLRLTPTPSAGMFPAIGHDFTRQMLAATGCPWDREDTDEFFYNWLVAGGTSPSLAGTYYGAVAGPVGSAFIALTRKTDPNLWIQKIAYP